MSPEHIRLYGLISAVVALPAVIYGAWPFIRGAIGGVLVGRVGMDFSIVAVLAIGMVVSLINMLRASTAVYFDALAMFVALLLAGRVVLMLTQEAARRGSRELGSMLPLVVRAAPDQDDADKAGNEETADNQWLSVDELVPGQTIYLERGETVPTDATCYFAAANTANGTTSSAYFFDTAVLTGESRPQRLAHGQSVPAGAVLLSDAAQLRVATSVDQSRLGKLLQEVRQGRWQPTPLITLVDAIQAWFTPVVLLMALAVGVAYWWIDPSRSFDQAIAVILVCCPCALGLATPMMTQFVLRASGHNMLIDNASVMEVIHQAKRDHGHIILDKTGTITTGVLTVAQWQWHHRVDNDAAIIDALESHSAHPISRSIQAYVSEHHSSPTSSCPDLQAVKEVLGQGLQATDEHGNIWRIGQEQWIGHDLSISGASSGSGSGSG